MEEKIKEKGEKAVREFAEHLSHLASNVLTKDTLDHFARAGSEVMKAINSTMEEMSIPEDVKRHLLSAERETILAARDLLDAMLQEVERIEKRTISSRDDLKKIEVEKRE